jgi:hypothetical protein
MARKGQLLMAGFALAFAASAQADGPPCGVPGKPACPWDLTAAGCGGASSNVWCDPIHGRINRVPMSYPWLIEDVPPASPVLTMHVVTNQLISVPLAVTFDAQWNAEVFLADGGQVPAGERAATLDSTDFAARRGPDGPLEAPAFHTASRGSAARSSLQQAPAHAMRLDTPSLNGRPDAILVATRVGGSAASSSAVGAYYDGASWWLYHEDLTPMTAEEMFFFAEGTGVGGRAVHTTKNDFLGIGVYLDDPRLNGKPEAAFVAQHVFAGSLNVSPLAGWYDAARGQWAVFNEAGSPLAPGEQIHYVTTTP